jgi:transcriptional regulator of acetoin/glycerol metabolism
MDLCLKDLLGAATVVALVAADGRVAAGRFCDECIRSGRALRVLAELRSITNLNVEGCEPEPDRLPRGTLREIVHAAIEREISICDGNIREAARRLNLSRSTIYRIRKEHQAAQLGLLQEPAPEEDDDEGNQGGDNPAAGGTGV